MANWLKNSLDIGEIEENGFIDLVFLGTDSTPKIKNIKAGCGCTKVKYDKDSNSILATYNAGVIPYHLRDKGIQEISKRIYVYYENGESEELFITGKKIKK